MICRPKKMTQKSYKTILRSFFSIFYIQSKLSTHTHTQNYCNTMYKYVQTSHIIVAARPRGHTLWEFQNQICTCKFSVVSNQQGCCRHGTTDVTGTKNFRIECANTHLASTSYLNNGDEPPCATQIVRPT